MGSKKGATVAGVAEGKELSPVPTGEDVLPVDKVIGLFTGSLSADIYEGWGAHLFQKDLKLESASASPVGKTVFTFTVQPHHTNRLGNLHGGAAATIFDVCTTTALAPIAKPGFWAYAGVTRTLNVTYIRPAPIGEVVEVTSEVVHAGKRLCTIKGVMKRKSDGAILTLCEHGKVSIDPEISKI